MHWLLSDVTCLTVNEHLDVADLSIFMAALLAVLLLMIIWGCVLCGKIICQSAALL